MNLYVNTGTYMVNKASPVTEPLQRWHITGTKMYI